MPRLAARYRRDHDTARFTQILRTMVDARRRVTVFAGPPSRPAADAIVGEFYWLDVDPKLAAAAIRESYSTVLELALQLGRPAAEIEAMISRRQVGALRLGIDGEWRLPREQVRSVIWAADAADQFMRSQQFLQYLPKHEKAGCGCSGMAPK